MFKFCILLIVALLVAPTISVQKQHMTHASKMAIEKLRNTKGSWASFLVNLAEVHVQSGGPLDELLEAIDEVIADLNKKLDRAHENYEKRTDLHHSEVTRIQALIDSAASDVAATTEYIGVLQLQLASLQQDVVTFEAAIEANKQNTQDAIALRAAQNADYLLRVPEHQEAIAAIDEALEVLSQLISGDDVSLIQMKNLRKNFDTIGRKMNAGKDQAILKALMQLAADSKFGDQTAILQVAQLMRDVRANLTGALATLEENEAAQVAQHGIDLFNFENELNRLVTELADANEAIVQTEQYIVDSEEFLAQRQIDKANSEQDLVDENDSFDRDTKTYEDLVEQFNTELNACNLAFEHLNNAEFADYIGNRMGQDVIIDQPHGSQITVETDPYDLE